MLQSVLPEQMAYQFQSLGSLTGLVLGTLLLAVVLQLVFKIVGLLRTRRKFVKIMKDFPGPPPHWLFGNMKQIMGPGESLRMNKVWTEQYGNIWPLWFSNVYPILKVTGPDNIKAICATAEPKDPVGYRFIEPWIGDGLLTSKGRKWARNRRLLTPSFHFDILKPYVDTFDHSANLLVNKWSKNMEGQDSRQFEMLQNVSLMTLHSLMKCIFGISDDSIQTTGETHPYIQAVYALAEYATKRFRFFPYHNELIFNLSPLGHKFRKACQKAHNFTRDVIDKKMKESEYHETDKTGKKYFDFIDTLLSCKDEDGNGLSYQEICDEVDTFMFEGHDTTASGISWCLYNLAAHPEYQQRCRDEINEALAGKPNIEWDDLPKFQYLAQCIKESLRLHPPVPNVGRQITKPLTFPDGRSVPEGTWIGISIYACHHNPSVWPDPDVYEPERFNIENSKDRHPHAFVPFSAGPRNCIGQHFAMNEMKTCVAKLIQKFELSVDPSKKPVPHPELVLRSTNGIWLNVKKVQ